MSFVKVKWPLPPKPPPVVAPRETPFRNSPWLKLSPSRLSTLKLNVKVTVAIGSVSKNGIAKSAELPSQQAAPEFGPIHSRSAKLLPQRFRFERW